MAFITYNHVGIRAMAACVPSRRVSNADLGYLIPPEEIDKMIRSVGIREKRYADDGVCASDLCFQAARQLMTDNDIAPDSIDVLLFMSQTADYRLPATAPLLQHRLGLAQTTAAMDLSLGCSGYVYALSAAYAYASLPGVKRVLLLDGETFSKVVSPYDKVNAPLYGDAGTATLIERGDDFEPCHILLMSDGSGEEAVKIPAGGCRIPATAENLQPVERADGSRRSDNQVYMDGMDVFNFTIRVVPRTIRELTERIGRPLGEIDYLLFHQANRFMTDFFVRKLKYPAERVPYSLDRFGNTSSASIPLTIVSELCGRLGQRTETILCGFGVGLSWGAVYNVFRNCRISPLAEYRPL